MLHPCAPLLPEEVVLRAKKLSVPLLLDGVKAAGLDIPGGGCMDAGILPVDRGMTVAGTALTVETREGDNLPIHLASYAFQADGYVMVIDGKGYGGCAYFGDLIMGACQAVGFSGMVVDGYTRDRDGNIRLGFPVYSRGFMPRGPVKREEGEINRPVLCGGVRVEPGDLVVGDPDGVCVIPRQHIHTVLEEAEKSWPTRRSASRPSPPTAGPGRRGLPSPSWPPNGCWR